MQTLLALSDLIIFAVLMAVGYVAGRVAEASHYASIRKREKLLERKHKLDYSSNKISINKNSNTLSNAISKICKEQPERSGSLTIDYWRTSERQFMVDQQQQKMKDYQKLNFVLDQMYRIIQVLN